MSDFTFCNALGRVVEMYTRVKVNDPANSGIVLVALKAAGVSTDAVLKDKNALSAVLASGTTAEATNSGYARKVITDAALAAVAPDLTNDRTVLTLPAQTWTSVAATGGAWAKLLICYDPDTTAGTDTTILPLVGLDFAITPNGGNVVASFSSSGFYRAT